MTPQQNLFSEQFEIEHWVNKRSDRQNPAIDHMVVTGTAIQFDDEQVENDDFDWE